MGKHTLPSSCPDPQAPDCCRPKTTQEEEDEKMTEGEAERRAVEQLEGFVPTLYDWPALTHGSSSLQRRAILASATTECEIESVRKVAAEVPENRWSWGLRTPGLSNTWVRTRPFVMTSPGLKIVAQRSVLPKCGGVGIDGGGVSAAAISAVSLS